MTPAAAEVTSLAGALTGFAKAHQTLAKLSGLRVAESTVERTTEAAGHRLGAVWERGQDFGAARPWVGHQDATGESCAYVSLDAICAFQQGPHGAQAPGRMASVAALDHSVPETPPGATPPGPAPTWAKRSLAGLSDLDDLGSQLRRAAAQIGFDQAEHWVALSDGGSGLEEFCAVQFPRAVCIIDFYHVAGYLAALGRALHPQDAAGAESWTTAACHRLKHEGGSATLEYLEGLGLQ